MYKQSINGDISSLLMSMVLAVYLWLRFKKSIQDWGISSIELLLVYKWLRQ